MITSYTVTCKYIVAIAAENRTDTVHNLSCAAYLINTINLKYLHTIPSTPVSMHQYSHNRTLNPAPCSFLRPTHSTISEK